MTADLSLGALREAIRTGGVRVLGDLSPSRVIQLAGQARRPGHRSMPRRRTA